MKALVAALPVPCDCLPERVPPGADGHACCAPPRGVSAADDGCCDASPELAEALPSPAAPADAASLAPANVPVTARSGLRAPARLAVPLAPSPPPTILRI
jgi:hypothetical protein